MGHRDLHTQYCNTYIHATSPAGAGRAHAPQAAARGGGGACGASAGSRCSCRLAPSPACCTCSTGCDAAPGCSCLCSLGGWGPGCMSSAPVPSQVQPLCAALECSWVALSGLSCCLAGGWRRAIRCFGVHGDMACRGGWGSGYPWLCGSQLFDTPCISWLLSWGHCLLCAGCFGPSCACACPRPGGMLLGPAFRWCNARGRRCLGVCMLHPSYGQ